MVLVRNKLLLWWYFYPRLTWKVCLDLKIPFFLYPSKELGEWPSQRAPGSYKKSVKIIHICQVLDQCTTVVLPLPFVRKGQGDKAGIPWISATLWGKYFMFMVLIKPQNKAVCAVQFFTWSVVTAVMYINGLSLLVSSGRWIFTDAIFTEILPVVTCKANNSQLIQVAILTYT